MLAFLNYVHDCKVVLPAQLDHVLADDDHGLVADALKCFHSVRNKADFGAVLSRSNGDGTSRGSEELQVEGPVGQEPRAIFADEDDGSKVVWKQEGQLGLIRPIECLRLITRSALEMSVRKYEL